MLQMKNIFGKENEISKENDRFVLFFQDNSVMKIRILLNRVIMNEQLMQLILMVLIIFMEIIISIHFSMAYLMYL